MTVTPADQYRILVESLRLAAAPPEAQLSALPDFVCFTCEISTLFTDAYLLAPQLEAAELTTPDADTALRRLNRFFGEVPSDAETSDAETLRSHWFWAETRRLAAEALTELCEDVRPADLSRITWVRGC